MVYYMCSAIYDGKTMQENIFLGKIINSATVIIPNG